VLIVGDQVRALVDQPWGALSINAGDILTITRIQLNYYLDEFDGYCTVIRAVDVNREEWSLRLGLDCEPVRLEDITKRVYTKGGIRFEVSELSIRRR
jgi:hypothetical protein